MTKYEASNWKNLFLTCLGCLVVSSLPIKSGYAQSFDFERLRRSIDSYVVILKINVEVSFGTQTNDHEEQLLGTVVSAGGLVVFDGGFLREDSPFVPSGGFPFRATPTRIRVTTLAGDELAATYLGVDRFSGFGFAQIADSESKFKPVSFASAANLEVGDWLATFILLPEFVEPRLSADVGMVSSLVKVPEAFPLTVGFSPIEFGGVLFDEKLRPVGLLGELTNPTQSGGGADDMNPYGGMEMPLLGVITAERLEKLIANPPRRGQADRSWLGITMQALTPDISGFLGIESPGGILVNEIVPGSPAENSGLRVGDVIYGVQGERVDVDREEELPVFQRQVSSLGVGSSVNLAVLRPREDGPPDTLAMTAVLSAAPLAASEADEFEYQPFEMSVRELVFSDFVGFNVEQNSLTGVVVTEVSSGGLADISGLNPGDVISQVNNRAISSTEEFSSQMVALETERPAEVVFFVWRFGQTLFIHVRTEWP